MCSRLPDERFLFYEKFPQVDRVNCTKCADVRYRSFHVSPQLVSIIRLRASLECRRLNQSERLPDYLPPISEPRGGESRAAPDIVEKSSVELVISVR